VQCDLIQKLPQQQLYAANNNSYASISLGVTLDRRGGGAGRAWSVVQQHLCTLASRSAAAGHGPGLRSRRRCHPSRRSSARGRGSGGWRALPGLLGGLRLPSRCCWLWGGARGSPACLRLPGASPTAGPVSLCPGQGTLPGKPAQGAGSARAGWGGRGDLDLLPESNSDVAADLGERLKERVAEGVDAERVDPADALDLYQVALDAGHHCPDVAEGDEGEEEAPDDCQGDAQDGGEQPVAPVLADGEGGVAGLPDAVEAVRSHGLGYHVLKIHLGGEKREVRGVWGGQRGLQGKDQDLLQREGRARTEGAGESKGCAGGDVDPLHP